MSNLHKILQETAFDELLTEEFNNAEILDKPLLYKNDNLLILKIKVLKTLTFAAYIQLKENLEDYFNHYIELEFTVEDSSIDIRELQRYLDYFLKNNPLFRHVGISEYQQGYLFQVFDEKYMITMEDNLSYLKDCFLKIGVDKTFSFEEKNEDYSKRKGRLIISEEIKEEKPKAVAGFTKISITEINTTKRKVCVEGFIYDNDIRKPRKDLTIQSFYICEDTTVLKAIKFLKSDVPLPFQIRRTSNNWFFTF